VPEIELLACPPTLYVRSLGEPLHDFSESCLRIVRSAAELDYHIQLIFLPASPRKTPVCFDGFYDESIEEFVKTILSGPCDDKSPSPVDEFAAAFLFAQSLIHSSSSPFPRFAHLETVA
jgi:hypothetical protein